CQARSLLSLARPVLEQQEERLLSSLPAQVAPLLPRRRNQSLKQIKQPNRLSHPTRKQSKA
ncbi:hypothetical protein, partial [Enterobacter hormaechei]